MKKTSAIKKIILASDLLNQRYSLKKKIGKGGLCSIYKAEDLYCEYFNDHKNFAIKVPLKKLFQKKDSAAFMYSEYKFLQKLNHENIIKVYDFGIDDASKIPYIVLEYLEGRLLFDIPIYELKKDFLIGIYNKVLKTLEYLHKQNIIHADINPKNIMLLKNDEIKLFDFGISQYKDFDDTLSLDLTKLKAYNPRYCAPEVLDGALPSFSSDIFSLACVFYELFTESLPFEECSHELKNKAITLFTCSSKIPMSLKFWFIKALTYDAKKRIS